MNYLNDVKQSQRIKKSYVFTSVFPKRFAVALALVLSSQSTTVVANEKLKSGFYTIVDGQGRLIVIRTDKTSKASKKVATAESQTKLSATSVDQSNQTTVNNSAAVAQPSNVLDESVKLAPDMSMTHATAKVIKNNQIQPSTKLQVPQANKAPVADIISTHVSDDPVVRSSSKKTPLALPTVTEAAEKKGLVDFQDDRYVDSQVLIDKSFNLNDEKRFFALPNGSGGVDFVERKSGVNLKNINTSPVSPLFSMASNYQRLPHSALAKLLPSSCVSNSALKNTAVLRSREPLNLWPREGKTNDFYANIVKLTEKDTRELSLVSYAHRASNPTYYWPLAIFLDSKGCVIEAAGQFFQEDIPATWLQQSGLKGNLLAPENASYLMLTPLEQSPDLPDKTLSKSGQLRLTVYGTEP